MARVARRCDWFVFKEIMLSARYKMDARGRVVDAFEIQPITRTLTGIILNFKDFRYVILVRTVRLTDSYTYIFSLVRDKPITSEGISVSVTMASLNVNTQLTKCVSSLRTLTEQS